MLWIFKWTHTYVVRLCGFKKKRKEKRSVLLYYTIVGLPHMEDAAIRMNAISFKICHSYGNRHITRRTVYGEKKRVLQIRGPDLMSLQQRYRKNSVENELETCWKAFVSSYLPVVASYYAIQIMSIDGLGAMHSIRRRCLVLTHILYVWDV